MTKPTRRTRTVSTADLAIATGGYTLTPTFTLPAGYYPQLSTIANATKSQDGVAQGDVDNLK